MVLSSWLHKWFYSIQLPSPLYFLIVNIISWNLLSSPIEVVFFNTYMISPHYRFFPYSSQHQYQKITHKFHKSKRFSFRHFPCFKIDKSTYLFVDDRNTKTCPWTLFLNRMHFLFSMYLLITSMVLFGVKEKSKYQHMPEFYVRSKLLKIFIVVVAVVVK